MNMDADKMEIDDTIFIPEALSKNIVFEVSKSSSP